jgi:hypothetical protein
MGVLVSALVGNQRQCPQCGVKLTKYEWSKLWWMSSGMSGRLVQPCQECGAKLKLSSMALISSLASLGLIITAISYLFYPASVLLFIALALLLVILVAMLATRIESVPAAPATIDPKPPRIGK